MYLQVGYYSSTFQAPRVNTFAFNFTMYLQGNFSIKFQAFSKKIQVTTLIYLSTSSDEFQVET